MQGRVAKASTSTRKEAIPQLEAPSEPGKFLQLKNTQDI